MQRLCQNFASKLIYSHFCACMQENCKNWHILTFVEILETRVVDSTVMIVLQ